MRMDALPVTTAQQASTMTIHRAMQITVFAVLLAQTVSPMAQITMTFQIVIYAGQGSMVEQLVVRIAM